jgi:molybdate transport system substrate-binding protein
MLQITIFDLISLGIARAMKLPLFHFFLIAWAIPNLARSQDLTVAVAANMQFVIRDLQKEFEAESKSKLTIILGSSGNLAAQITQGGPFDLFISADTLYPQEIYQRHLASDHPRIYAQGTLVLWSLKKDINLSGGLQILLDRKINKIALANPTLAPYGRAAEEVLRKLGLFDQVAGKLVYGESISQTNQYILSQAADIGFTAKSVVMSVEMQGRGAWIDIPRADYSPIEQAAVILNYGRKNHDLAARKFFDFLFSPPAKSILIKYGYLVNP